MNVIQKILLLCTFVILAGTNAKLTQAASFRSPDNGCDLYVSEINVRNVTCYGGSDGSISLKIEGGTGQYQISLDKQNWMDNQAIEGLTAGKYAVYIRDLQLECSIQTDGIEIEQRDRIEEFKEMSICEGDSIFLADRYRKAPGEYIDTLTGRTGCDSVVITQLTLKERPPLDLGADEMDVCFGDELKFDIGHPDIESYYFSNQVNSVFTPVFEFTYNEFQAPVYLYAEVTGINGCKSADTLYFRNNSIKEFGISYIDQTKDPTIRFKAYVQDNAESWYWIIDKKTTVPDILEGEYEFKKNGQHEICFFAENGCGIRSKCVPVSVTEAKAVTAVQDISTSFKLYPNPARDILHLEGLQNPTQIRIYNLEGKNLLNTTIIDGKTNLELSGWDGGIYIVEVKFRDGIIRKKLIIQ